MSALKPSADLTITLVDHGADATSGGGRLQHVVTYNTTNDNQIAGGQWVDLEIKLAT